MRMQVDSPVALARFILFLCHDPLTRSVFNNFIRLQKMTELQLV
jgi:hypothetical protein